LLRFGENLQKRDKTQFLERYGFQNGILCFRVQNSDNASEAMQEYMR